MLENLFKTLIIHECLLSFTVTSRLWIFICSLPSFQLPFIAGEGWKFHSPFYREQYQGQRSGQKALLPHDGLVLCIL